MSFTARLMRMGSHLGGKCSTDICEHVVYGLETRCYLFFCVCDVNLKRLGYTLMSLCYLMSVLGVVFIDFLFTRVYDLYNLVIFWKQLRVLYGVGGNRLGGQCFYIIFFRKQLYLVVFFICFTSYFTFLFNNTDSPVGCCYHSNNEEIHTKIKCDTFGPQ